MADSSQLKEVLLLWLSKEEERLVKQRTFLENIKISGGLAAINADAIISLEPSFEEYISRLGFEDVL